MGWGKEAAAWTAVAVAAGFGNFLLGCYCGNYGGGGGGGYSRIYETEPNDVAADANPIGLTPRDFEGDCAADTLDNDFFRVAVTGSGYAFVEITWEDDAYDIDLAVTGSGYAFGDTALPPGDSPISLTGTASTSGQMYLHVICKGAGENPVHYLGHVEAPY